MATYASFLRQEGIDGSTITRNLDRTISANGPMQPAGGIWYVDGNRTSSGDGKTWESAFQKLSEGLLAAATNRALTGPRNWAGRETIYFKGDDVGTSGNQVEDLILFAAHTDVIGVGACDGYAMPQILGNHIPKECGGVRFYNVLFRGENAAGTIMTLDSTTLGIEFHGCVFNGHQDTPAAIGIQSTAAIGLKVIGCEFNGLFSTAAISLLAGNGDGTKIAHNIIEAAGIGILVNASFTCLQMAAFINDNIIYTTTGMVFNDNSNKCAIFGNLCVADGLASINDTSHNISDGRSAGNIVTGSDETNTVPLAAIS